MLSFVQKQSRVDGFALAHSSNTVSLDLLKPCWVSLFRGLVSPLLEGIFGWNFGLSKTILWTLNLLSFIWKQSRLDGFALAHFSNTVGLDLPKLYWVPLFKGIFGWNFGLLKTILWTSNLQFFRQKKSRLPCFKLVHFSYPVSQICWNLAEFPCLGHWLTHFPRDFLDEIWGFEVHIMNFEFAIFRLEKIASASFLTRALFLPCRPNLLKPCQVPMSRALANPLPERVFGRNLGFSKSIIWASNLQLTHFFYPIGQICWNLAEHPCLGH